MRVLVTGSRQFIDRGMVYSALDEVAGPVLMRGFPDDEIVVVHGAAPGADTLANEWVHDRRGSRFVRAEIHPAQWNRYPLNLAGPIRNQEMVNLGADICLAFLVGTAANRGTKNCMNLARLAGIEVKEHWT